MKLQRLWVIAAMLAAAVPAFARDIADNDPVVKDLKVERSENNLFVSMRLDVSDVKMQSDREVSYTPVLTCDGNRMELPRVIVAGHNRYIRNLRGDLKEGDLLSRSGEATDYAVVLPYEEWMERAVLTLVEDRLACGYSMETDERTLAELDFTPKIFAPSYAFVTPAADAVKMRSVRGSAYIDFKVNRTEIDPAYRRNAEELKKISGTIDGIRQDPDMHITSLSIKGFASPEGPYANNERLAAGRVAALLDYVRGLYRFPDDILSTSYEPEDWAGLERSLDTCRLDDRDAILDIVRGPLEPDAKEWRIKSKYPEAYAYLLKEVYPGLRHSDYVVDYVIRSYTDLKEIEAVMKSDPRKLSLHEMNLLAQSLEPGSDEYREVYEVAVRMYPDDPVANLNAANISLSRGELDRAEAYLAKASDSPETTYARGILAAMRERYDDADRLLGEASAAGVTQADDALRQLRDMGRLE